MFVVCIDSWGGIKEMSRLYVPYSAQMLCLKMMFRLTNIDDIINLHVKLDGENLIPDGMSYCNR